MSLEKISFLEKLFIVLEIAEVSSNSRNLARVIVGFAKAEVTSR